ncbi:MAG: peptidase T [Spirochaetales bacterium]|uniref:Peptidase T n=1 Tax=Candidatus Thalassospirochaeta sargassi TaxID=3119039 RepID=A0AAJ1MNW9_9SPIO|nr:peptidase T [Spirochaetales bacterium]
MKELLERFVRYAEITTTSDIHKDICPSTECQWDLLRLLEQELEDLGLSDISLNENGYLIARLESNTTEDVPVIGLMAHVDTAADVSGTDVKPQIHKNYDGSPIVLKDGTVIDPAEDSHLGKYRGETIITSDGTTLLGADDKAGVAEIMTAIKYFVENPEEKHGTVEIIFTPDEETGKGMDRFPREKLKSVFCYTLDGGEEGEIDSECFNAYGVDVHFEGRAIHLGDARGRLVNAVTMSSSFIGMLPQAESPEATDGRFGYYCPFEVTGGVEKADLMLFLRDFELSELKRRIEALKTLGKAVEAMFPGGRVSVSEKKQYLNMREHMDKIPEGMEYLLKAAAAAGVVTTSEIIRGGTDGARLSEMGIPTPNIFTGGHNYHSKKEWAVLSTMEKSCMTAINLVKLWAGQEVRTSV